MRLTRREFCQSTAFVALATALGLSALPVETALAQAAVSETELMAPNALPDMALGDAKATVTIIEYASMTCSHCAAFHNTTYPALKAKYIDSGKVRYILREFPLDPLAAGAFMLARCAGGDKYYPMVELLFQKQKDWVVQNPIPPLLSLAKQAGFTQESFETCLKDQKVLEAIEAVRTHGAEKLGVNSTPTFFINGKVMRGALSIEDLDRELQPLLKS